MVGAIFIIIFASTALTDFMVNAEVRDTALVDATGTPLTDRADKQIRKRIADCRSISNR